MSEVLIKGMEMPTSCLECPLTDGHSASCLITEKSVYFSVNKIHDGCPLVPVLPHGKLIEAEPIIKFITDGLNSGEFGYDQIKVLAEVQYAPTIIPAEESET